MTHFGSCSVKTPRGGYARCLTLLYCIYPAKDAGYLASSLQHPQPPPPPTSAPACLTSPIYPPFKHTLSPPSRSDGTRSPPAEPPCPCQAVTLDLRGTQRSPRRTRAALTVPYYLHCHCHCGDTVCHSNGWKGLGGDYAH